MIHSPFMSLLQILIPILLFAVFSIILLYVLNSMITWSHENKYPVSTVQATVLTKRTQVIPHFHEFETHLFYPTSIYYFATFEFENGENMELEMNAQEFNKMAEGDFGSLTFQGDDLLHFIKAKDLDPSKGESH